MASAAKNSPCFGWPLAAEIDEVTELTETGLLRGLGEVGPLVERMVVDCWPSQPPLPPPPPSSFSPNVRSLRRSYVRKITYVHMSVDISIMQSDGVEGTGGSGGDDDDDDNDDNDEEGGNSSSLPESRRRTSGLDAPNEYTSACQQGHTDTVRVMRRGE